MKILDKNVKDDEIDTCYGWEEYIITQEEIQALLDGKRLYTTINCDEYAITIKMEEKIDDQKVLRIKI